jgi:hypothetical protein
VVRILFFSAFENQPIYVVGLYYCGGLHFTDKAGAGEFNRCGKMFFLIIKNRNFFFVCVAIKSDNLICCNNGMKSQLSQIGHISQMYNR